MNVMVIWGGTNDLGAGDTPQQAYAQLVQFCQQGQAAGWKVIVVTMIDRSGIDGAGETFDAAHDAYNNLIRANWTSFANGIADVAANPILGADGASTNPTYFLGDGIHLTDAGYQLVAPTVQAAKDQLVLGAGSPSSTTSTIVSSPGSVTANGTSTTTLTVTVPVDRVRRSTNLRRRPCRQ
jgi:lysophospholipase L1-like esterase